MRVESLQIQSVIYGNSVDDLVRAAEATANAARYAVDHDRLSSWSLVLGDCSPEPPFSTEVLARLRAEVGRDGGEFTYEHFGANLGSAAGHNRLAETGSSEGILILNPDAVMAYDTLANLIALSASDIGIVEARQIPIDHPKDYDPLTGDTSWASTACALTSRAVFESVGGFDAATFFLYCDDVDYSWRVRLAGYRVVSAPSARLFHDKRLNLRGEWPTSAAERYYSSEAELLLAHKYSRPQLVRQRLRELDESPHDHERHAAVEFRRRQTSGELPVPIDPDHRVGQFYPDRTFAVHRFAR